jgi:hypothetical protein
MEAIVLKDIPFTLDRSGLFRRLDIRPGSDLADEVELLAARAEEIARPKAVYRPCFLDSRGEDEVVLEGVAFRSRILAVNLKDAHRVFAYVLTCGTELQAWSDSLGDPLERFWAEAINQAALQAAQVRFEAHMEGAYGLDRKARMNPGSLPDWPLPQQEPLFRLLGDVEGSIGVRLSGSFVMMPTKSVSGILFPTESGYVNCQLCPRETCPGRKAPYDAGLFQRRFASK